jgi:hypothetical protein
MVEPVFLDVELADYDGGSCCSKTSGCDKCRQTPSWTVTHRVTPQVGGAKVSYQGASLYDTTGFDPSDLTYGGLFNKPVSWMGYPPKEVRCTQCQRYLPITLPVGVTSMVIYCESCRHMKDTAHGG